MIYVSGGLSCVGTAVKAAIMISSRVALSSRTRLTWKAMHHSYWV